jgi:Holliday junction DNA helicase RuvA
MIAFIKGKIAYKTRTELIVETGGLGYWVHITLNTYNQIAQQQEVQLHTCFIVKEDSHTLYGFADIKEKEMFEHLISVSGVGPSTARLMLSALTPAEIQQAIIAENVNILRNAKGIGPKSAKRIILELKDVLLKNSGIDSEQIASTLNQPATENVVREEALSALLALGFNKIQTQKVLNALLKERSDIKDSGELIKLALGQLT